MRDESAFRKIFLASLWTDETVKCAPAECTWYFEDLAFCLFIISELKDSIFHDTYLIFVYKNHTIGYYIAIFVQALDFFTSFSCFVAFLSVHNGGKNVMPLVKRSHGSRSNTLLVYYLLVWASCKQKKNSIGLSIILLYFKCLT